MKKRIFIAILAVIIIISIIVIINIINLNTNEKEVLNVLRDLDYSLQNPKNIEDTIFNFKPLNPIALKEYVNTIYEVRKISGENGNLIFLLRVGFMESDGSEYESILAVSNGELLNLTIDENSLENIDNVGSNSFENNINKTLQKNFVHGVNRIITEKWNEATVIKNVNFRKILDRI